MARKALPKVKVEDKDNLIERLAKIERENQELRNNSENYAIALDAYIEVVSLFPGKLNLSTEPMGKGKRYSFSSFGETKRILYVDLASIMEHYRSFMENGLFYIMNEKLIRKHGLDDMYANILTQGMIQKILDCDPKLAVKLYESATPAQRENIDSLLIQEMKKNEVDLNIIAQISKIGGSDLIKLTEEVKQLEALPA